MDKLTEAQRRPTTALPCPICGRAPDIDRTATTGWYANCYDMGRSPEEEHNFGVNAETRSEVVKAWNDAVLRERHTPAGRAALGGTDG